MAENIIGKFINGVKVLGVAYMDSYEEEIYECQENDELVYLSYDEIVCEESFILNAKKSTNNSKDSVIHILPLESKVYLK
ncbi:hypothetical protein [Psychrobacillus psychrodurans]|uniref:Uncharacterized protein n=1 Tax=Psychrobacillus psychrodurans TaxID=126157 RepID=A0A9X3L964_9BACI|nr:hypothetical protein [Psychrobacillus psychrodurans]MCZ8533545.1 hypothetical protein [Psychrobacillus psychrodurans]